MTPPTRRSRPGAQGDSSSNNIDNASSAANPRPQVKVDCRNTRRCGRSDQLTDAHAAYFAARAVDPDVVAERGVLSYDTAAEVQRLGFGRKTPHPGFAMQLHSVVGETWGYQVRPDVPRVADGSILKFEVPHRWKPRLDVHTRTLPLLADPSIPLWLTEGIPKGDALVSAGVAAVAMLGVWNWGGDALADFEYLRPKGRQFYIAFDSDVMLKQSVRHALVRLGRLPESRGVVS